MPVTLNGLAIAPLRCAGDRRHLMLDASERSDYHSANDCTNSRGCLFPAVLSFGFACKGGQAVAPF
jgi:hypothetical protein